jgi:proteasome lid subunit RPN8/RPN11
MTTVSTSSEPRPDATAADAYTPPTAADLVAQLPAKSPPAPLDGCLLHGEPPAPGEPVVLVHQTALLQANAHSLSNVDLELGGALLGHAYRHEGSVIVEIKAALPATSADHGPVHFTFAADSWSQLQRDRATHYPNLDIVGWFHTHPDLGVFYSSDDVVVHSAAFTLPWHVGLVIDPLREQAGFFGWCGGQLQPLSGFYELPERQPESIVTWRAVKTAVWDTPYAPPADPALAASRVYLPGAAAGQSVSTNQAGLILGALGLALALLLWLFGIMPLRQQVNTLETALLAVADTSLATTNAAACPDPRLRLIAPVAGQSFAMGSSVPIIGTTEIPDATRYQLELRPVNSPTWALLERSNRDSRLSTLATWDSTGYAQGTYEIRLSAVDLNNIRLVNSPACSIIVQLVP